MKPTPEQVEAAKAWTKCDESSRQHALLLGSHTHDSMGRIAAEILLAALEAAEADSARLPIEALGFAFAWACTALDEGKDPREVEVPALMDAWGKAQALAARKAQP